MNNYYYDAFISYRHLPEDKIIAEKLQRLLERLTKTDPATGKKRPLRVFRDQSELPVSEDLSNDINQALHTSDYLIIICSPTLKESRWCMKELTVFRELHGNTNAHIIPLLIDGEPEESFPDAIRFRQISYTLEDGTIAHETEEIEPLAADVRDVNLANKLKKLKKTEYMRVAAPILGVRFDDLYQRRKRERNRKLLIGVSAALIVLIAVSMYFVYSQVKLSMTRLHALQTEAERIAELSESETKDPALAYLLAENAYNMFSDERDIPEKVKQIYTGNALSYLLGLQSNLLQLQFSDSFPSAIEDSMRICGDGKYLALTDGSKTYLYDIAKGKQIFSCDSSIVYFDPNGTVAASSYVKDGKNICDFYRIDTGDFLCTVQDDRRYGAWAATAMEVYWENDSCYAVDADNSRVFEIRISEDWQTEISEDVSQSVRKSLISSCYGNPGHYRKVFYLEALPGVMTAIGEYKSELTDEQKTACDTAAEKGFTVAAIQTGQKIGLLKCTLDNTAKTILYSEATGDILNTMDGCLYYDSATGLCFGMDYETVSVYTINEAFSATQNDRFYSRVSPDGERYFALSGESEERAYGKGGLIRMLICDMTRPENKAVVFDESLYTSSTLQNYLCYCNTDLTRVFYFAPYGDLVLYDIPQRKKLISWQVKEPKSVQAVSLNEDGSLLAAAYSHNYKEFEVVIYSAATGDELQTIDLTDKIGKTRITGIMHMEFHDDLLLVSTENDSILMKRKNDLYETDTAEIFSKLGNRCYPWPCLISDDGFIFFTGQTEVTNPTHPRYLYNIYSVSDDKEITGVPFSNAFIYSPDRKSLIAEEFVSGGVSNSSIVSHAGAINLFRYEDGTMQKDGELISKSPDMHLADRYVTDGNYVLLENSDCSEIYDLTTKRLVCTVSVTGLILSDGRIINSALEIPTLDNAYPYLSDGKELQSVVSDVMTKQSGKPRVLIDAEKEKYGISD